MYKKTYFLILVLFISSLSACCRKNSKIEKLSSFVSTIQSGYKSFTEEDWVYCDKKLNKLLANINKCSHKLTSEDIAFIDKQKNVYKKVKIKWEIENLKLLKDSSENNENSYFNNPLMISSPTIYHTLHSNCSTF